MEENKTFEEDLVEEDLVSVSIDYDNGKLGPNSYHSGRGWYFWETDYPYEGSNGPYDSKEEILECIKQINGIVELDYTVSRKVK